MTSRAGNQSYVDEVPLEEEARILLKEMLLAGMIERGTLKIPETLTSSPHKVELAFLVNLGDAPAPLIAHMVRMPKRWGWRERDSRKGWRANVPAHWEGKTHPTQTEALEALRDRIQQSYEGE